MYTCYLTVHLTPADASLNEPLLDDEVEGSSSDTRRHDDSHAIVPRSINRYDWEALIAAFANACKSGWSGVLSKSCWLCLAKNGLLMLHAHD